MLSAFTAQGAKATLAALETGAFDFVLKPSGASMAANVEHLRRELRAKLAAYARRRNVKQILGRPSSGAMAMVPQPRCRRPPRRAGSPSAGPPQVVALGISTGGPKALTEMVPQLPANLPVPLLIVQHMPPVFTKSLADDLNNRTRADRPRGRRRPADPRAARSGSPPAAGK